MGGHVGLALMGLGRAGKIHFKNAVKNARIDLRYLVEENVAIAEQLISDYRLTSTKAIQTNDVDMVLNDPSVTACVIATPTETHENLVMACLRAQKAVMCEKPLANSVEAIGKSLIT